MLDVMRLDHGVGLPTPNYATIGSSGMDVCAAIGSDEVIILPSMERKLIPTGFCFAIPDNYEIQVRSRSGLSLHNGIAVLNSPGTIDSDYRGELQILLINFSDTPFVVRRGDRIAQIVLTPVVRAKLREVPSLDLTIRDKDGFGSTG